MSRLAYAMEYAPQRPPKMIAMKVQVAGSTERCFGKYTLQVCTLRADEGCCLGLALPSYSE